MTSTTRHSLRRLVGGVLAATCALSSTVPAAHAQDATTPSTASGVQAVSNAEFRWSINDESRGRAFAPGTVNLISAGDISAAIPGAGKVLPASSWKQQSGSVHVDRRTADGAVAPATWASTQQSAGFVGTQGAAMGAAASGDHSGSEAVFTGGSGTVDPASGTADVTWSGALTVLYYSGMSYYTVSDPELKVGPGGATLTVTIGAHRTSMTDTSIWEKMAPARVEWADFAPGAIALGGTGGFTASPQFQNVRYDGGQQVRTGQWGSFPPSFVDYVSRAGAGAYWYTSGGASDRLKVPNPVAVSWDAAAPVAPAPQPSPNSPSTSTTTSEPTSRLQKFLDDLADAGQARVLDNTKAITGDLIDQAFGRSQKVGAAAPGAVRSTTASGQTTATGQTTTSGRSTTTTSRSTVIRDVGDYLVATGQPVTAGNVGRVVTQIAELSPTSSGVSGAGAAAARPASAPVAGASSVQGQSSPAAAKQPVDGQPVLYSSTSADEAEGPAHHWQWFLGVALLAIAAVLVFRTLIRKA